MFQLKTAAASTIWPGQDFSTNWLCLRPHSEYEKKKLHFSQQV